MSTRLIRVRRLLLVLLSVFAFGAVTAAAAQASEEAPFWSREGVRLGEGETRFITAKSYKKTVLKSPSLGITVTCPELKIKEGVILGSKAGEHGTSSETIEFEGACTQTGNGAEPGCKVKVPIVAKAIADLVENVEGGKQGKKLLVLFTPPVGVAKFAVVEFVEEKPGTKQCKNKTIAVEGSVAGEARTDPNNGELGEVVELGQAAKEATSWLVNFPATPIKEVWLIKGGVGSVVKVELKAATETATFEGTALILLAESTTKWSPLP